MWWKIASVVENLEQTRSLSYWRLKPSPDEEGIKSAVDCLSGAQSAV